MEACSAETLSAIAWRLWCSWQPVIVTESAPGPAATATPLLNRSCAPLSVSEPASSRIPWPPVQPAGWAPPGGAVHLLLGIAPPLKIVPPSMTSVEAWYMLVFVQSAQPRVTCTLAKSHEAAHMPMMLT